ncbi:MAG: hypothetical protein FJ088_15560, partial [Deltaproteobacteria bacterium]|nr:hypothetical protein [Deltaproteobacteria bacterium]
GENQDVFLNIPLNRSFKVKLLDPPSGSPGPDFNYLFIFLDFGAEGVFQTKEEVFGFGAEYLVIKAQPDKFAGDIYDVGFTFLGGAFSSTADNTPFSIVLYPNMQALDDDLLVRVEDGKAVKENTGLNRNINGMFYLGDGEFFAACEDGIYYFNGVSFTKQSTPQAKGEIRALWGGDPGEIWAVGDFGQIWFYNGAGWSDLSPAAQNNLRGISGTSKDNIIAAGYYKVMRYNGTKWEDMWNAPFKDYYDVYAIDQDNIMLAGAQGTILRFNGSAFMPEASGVAETIYGVWGDSPENIWAVGGGGTILRFNGAAWEPVAGNTTRALWDVAGLEEGGVLIAGDGGTLLMFENGVIKDISDKGIKTDLRSVIFDDSAGHFVIGGMSAVVMYP